MAAYAIIDETTFPIVTIRFTGEGASDQNFQHYLDAVKAVYDQQQRLSLIFDARQARLPALKYQKMQAQWLKDNEQMMQSFCAGTAYVINQRIIRSVLRAIFSLQTQPVPYVVVGSEEEAIEWCTEQLSRG